jgi:hypothetical protein
MQGRQGEWVGIEMDEKGISPLPNHNILPCFRHSRIE